jgi:hypothetical protein
MLELITSTSSTRSLEYCNSLLKTLQGLLGFKMVPQILVNERFPPALQMGSQRAFQKDWMVVQSSQQSGKNEAFSPSQKQVGEKSGKMSRNQIVESVCEFLRSFSWLEGPLMVSKTSLQSPAGGTSWESFRAAQLFLALKSKPQNRVPCRTLMSALTLL